MSDFESSNSFDCLCLDSLAESSAPPLANDPIVYLVNHNFVSYYAKQLNEENPDNKRELLDVLVKLDSYCTKSSHLLVLKSLSRSNLRGLLIHSLTYEYLKFSSFIEIEEDFSVEEFATLTAVELEWPHIFVELNKLGLEATKSLFEMS